MPRRAEAVGSGACLYTARTPRERSSLFTLPSQGGRGGGLVLPDAVDIVHDIVPRRSDPPRRDGSEKKLVSFSVAPPLRSGQPIALLLTLFFFFFSL